jgi:hypothetical protein
MVISEIQGSGEPSCTIPLFILIAAMQAKRALAAKGAGNSGEGSVEQFAACA